MPDQSTNRDARRPWWAPPGNAVEQEAMRLVQGAWLRFFAEYKEESEADWALWRQLPKYVVNDLQRGGIGSLARIRSMSDVTLQMIAPWLDNEDIQAIRAIAPYEPPWQ